MMKMRTSNDLFPPRMKGGLTGGGSGGGGGGDEKKWELRPGGMLVQKRTDEEQNRVPPPTIRVRVKYGSVYHEIYINSQASFGELKKMLTAPTGLHHLDQKLFYKDKERTSAAFLDSVGVKDKSKIILQEDLISHEKRCLEMKNTAKMEKTLKLISDISLEVDRLAGQISGLETIVSKGGKLSEKDITSRIDSLMTQLVKLDEIVGDGDVKLQRKTQVKRVQKYVETLDRLKLKASMADNEPKNRDSNGSNSSSIELQQSQNSLQTPRSSSLGAAVVITTQWETFDSTPPLNNDVIRPPPQTAFTWDLL